MRSSILNGKTETPELLGALGRLEGHLSSHGGYLVEVTTPMATPMTTPIVTFGTMKSLHECNKRVGSGPEGILDLPVQT